jgi:formylglycine-generating enzyme required for sulfatase activity
MTTFTLQRQRRQAQYFTEDLASGIGLDMILVPGGSFLMGSPDTELERQDRESPQHTVTVPTFFMGRYPLTQAQWKVIARLPQVKRKLKLDPSHFKDNDRPVEQVSWFDAVEFCERLSRKTGRTYRLPSEAEWEYACRAGTTTPFHVGETITTDLANYDGNYTYGQGTKGIRRGETTAVGSFPPNAFGLCDMHGNVNEWCLDHWHENYEDVPLDGGAWLTKDEQAPRVICGGSWFYGPQACRSAYRSWLNPDFTPYIIGFRVVCVMPRT